MREYLIRRFLFLLVVLAGISVISFVVINLPPGDYLTSYVANLEQLGIQVDAELAQSMRERYGLDQPLFLRYFTWMGNLLRGDFGESFLYNRPARDVLFARIPMTALLALATLIFELAVAIPIGVYSAVKQYSIGDYIATVFGFIGLAVPNFLLALILMFAFYHGFGVLPGGLFSPEYREAAWSLARVLDFMRHLWVPVIVIGTAGTAGTIRVMRAMLLDELGKDYVKTAISKGVPRWKVVLRHPFRVSLNPIISTIGWLLPAIISGEAIVSVVLNLPTTGPVLLEALRGQDMYLAGSFVMLLSVLTVIGTLISDILLAVIDPRIRYETKA